MAYWWVNQNQTWKQEIDGGFLWSPKRNRNGAYNQFYENMVLVKSGDIVFSFFEQQIRFVGVAQTQAVSANKPIEFRIAGANWNSDGWYLPVRWHSSPIVVRPRDHIDELRPKLPAKYSPLHRASGNGLQCVYLAQVPNEMAQVLVKHFGPFGDEILQLN